MNKIVRSHYPVEKLDDDLRAELGPSVDHVTLVVEGEEKQSAERPPTLLDLVRSLPEREGRFKNVDDIVDYVRVVRDGGDLSPWLGPLSTSTRTP